MIATCLGAELRVPAASELGAAFGAARLALIANTGAAPEQALTPPAISRTIAPDSHYSRHYDAAYQDWLQLMPEVRRASVSLGQRG